MRKILLIIVCFFAMKNIAMPSSLPGFLVEEAAAEPSPNQEGVHEPMEEEGLHLHYAYGTKGFWVCLAIALGFT
jgi:hypothetical protein